MKTTTYPISFPSIHGTGGQGFHAEADAPTEALAIRAVLEAVAAQGITLERVVLSGIPGLDGARLDGLKLDGCKLDRVDLSGASLRNADIKGCRLISVLGDSRTRLDGAVLDDVLFEGCNMNGLQAAELNASALRFVRCSVDRWHVPDAAIRGLLLVATVPKGWQAHMTTIRDCNDAEGLIARADLTENQKAAMRALRASNGNRETARHYFDTLQAQDAAAAQA